MGGEAWLRAGVEGRWLGSRQHRFGAFLSMVSSAGIEIPSIVLLCLQHVFIEMSVGVLPFHSSQNLCHEQTKL